MLHALSSVFATCACGARSETCVLRRLAEFVNSDSEHPFLNGHTDGAKTVDLGPLVGPENKRGFKTRERVPWSGGVGGVEVVPTQRPRGHAWYGDVGDVWEREQLPEEQRVMSRRRGYDRKGKGRAVDGEDETIDAGTCSCAIFMRLRGTHAHMNTQP